MWRERINGKTSTAIFDGSRTISYSSVFEHGFIHAGFGGLEVTDLPIAWDGIPLVPFVRSKVPSPHDRGDLEALFPGKATEMDAMQWQDIEATTYSLHGKTHYRTIIFPAVGKTTLVEREVDASGLQGVGEDYIPTYVVQKDFTAPMPQYGGTQQVDRQTEFRLVRAIPSIDKALIPDPEKIVPSLGTAQIAKDGLSVGFIFDPKLGRLTTQADSAMKRLIAGKEQDRVRGSSERNAPFAAGAAIILTVAVILAFRKVNRRGA
jgi:hypothetical protein